jgi:hypothetical protein
MNVGHGKSEKVQTLLGLIYSNGDSGFGHADMNRSPDTTSLLRRGECLTEIRWLPIATDTRTFCFFSCLTDAIGEQVFFY